VNLEERISLYKRMGVKAVSNAHYYWEQNQNDKFHAYLRIYNHFADKLNELYVIKRNNQ
jgi:hypothetical protein